MLAPPKLAALTVGGPPVPVPPTPTVLADIPVRWCAFDGGGLTPAPVDGQALDSGGGGHDLDQARRLAVESQIRAK